MRIAQSTMMDAHELVRRLVDAHELARRLDVKVPTIRAWTRLTDIPRVQCGRLVRFDYEEVLSWFRARSAR